VVRLESEMPSRRETNKFGTFNSLPTSQSLKKLKKKVVYRLMKALLKIPGLMITMKMMSLVELIKMKSDWMAEIINTFTLNI